MFNTLANKQTCRWLLFTVIIFYYAILILSVKGKAHGHAGEFRNFKTKCLLHEGTRHQNLIKI